MTGVCLGSSSSPHDPVPCPPTRDEVKTLPLQNGNSMHPYFPWYGRIAGDGAQLAVVSVFRVRTTQNTPDTAWDPLSPFQSKWVPQSPQSHVEIYRGPGRVQPNQDWRARKNEVAAEVVVEQAVRIDIAMAGNVLPGFESIMPLIRVGDWVQCIDVVQLQNQPADDIVSKMNYVVRNISSSSNSWEKTLLCDVTPNSMTLGDEV
jgi:hypothetical protein